MADDTKDILSITPPPVPLKITEEFAKSFKGRIPDALAPVVVAFNKNKKIKQRTTKYKAALFMKAFVSNGGQAQKAAMEAFSLTDPHTASAAGTYWLKQIEHLLPAYMESKGAGVGRLLDIAIEKAYTSPHPEWWDRLMKIGRYHDFMDRRSGNQVQVNIHSTQKDLVNEYVEGDYEEYIEETGQDEGTEEEKIK